MLVVAVGLLLILPNCGVFGNSLPITNNDYAIGSDTVLPTPTEEPQIKGTTEYPQDIAIIRDILLILIPLNVDELEGIKELLPLCKELSKLLFTTY